jgi:hypothetical protein
MGVISAALLVVISSPQGTDAAPPSQAPGRAAQQQQRLGVEFDPRTGWPRTAPPAPRAVPEAPPAPAAEVRADGGRANAPVPGASAPGAQSSGMQSPLQRAFQVVQSPAAFAALEGVAVRWRITVYGPQGETLGARELTQTADLAHADRDRLEHADGRTCGRMGREVFAERQGAPWPTLVPSAAHELALFGLLLRTPWAFADNQRFDELGTDTAVRGGETLARVRLQRHTDDAALGPVPQATPDDQFVLWCDPASRLPRELEYTLAASGQSRRVRFEDWRAVPDEGGPQLPFRRVFVDAQGRTTTVLEIVSLKTGVDVGEREFRLH